MKIVRISVCVLVLITSFSAFNAFCAGQNDWEGWDAFGNPINQPEKRGPNDCTGDWDAFGNPR